MARRAEIPIVFITGHGDIPMSVRAMKAGRRGFPRQAVPGRRPAPGRAGGHRAGPGAPGLNDAERRQLPGCLRTLTPREREVMALVVRGLPNKRIATELGNIREDDQGSPRSRDGENEGPVRRRLVRASQKLGIGLEPPAQPD